MRRLLGQLTQTPAIVLGRRMDILAWNAAATALYTDFARVPARQRNYVRLMFTDPAFRAIHPNWEHDARTAVASLRMHGADDPELAVLVGELSLRDPDFRTWWAAHLVTGTGYGTKHYRHPLVGDLTLDCDTWDSPDGSGQRLMVLTAEPGTASHDRLRILTALTGGRAAPVVGRIGPGDLERAAVASWLSWCATRKRSPARCCPATAARASEVLALNVEDLTGAGMSDSSVITMG